MNQTHFVMLAARQRGATLLVSLIMLVILTLFAVSAFNLSSANLKIVGNFQQSRAIEAVAQIATEQVISDISNFNLSLPLTQTVCVNGTGSYCTGGNNVLVAVTCNYAVAATGYTKAIFNLMAPPPEDTDWETRAVVTDPLTGTKAVIVRGSSIMLLAGRCVA